MSKVKDLSLASFGRKEIELAEHEMAGLIKCRDEFKGSLEGTRISGCLHMTIQTAVLIETLEALGAKVQWCSCNIFSTQDHAAAAIAANGTCKVFAWKGETLEEYWNCIVDCVTWDDADGPDLLVDDGADMTWLIHEGVKREKAFAKTGAFIDVEAEGSNEEEKVVYTLLNRKLKENPTFWQTVSSKIQGVSEETTTGIKRILNIEKKNELLFPAINVNDAVTKSKFDNLYGCRHGAADSILRATDVLLAGKKALALSYGMCGKGAAHSLAAQKAIVRVSEIDPICALQALMDGYEVKRIESVLHDTDVFITASGNCELITFEHMKKMKNGAIVCNIGHFDDEFDVASLNKYCKRVEIKPLVDKYIFDDGHYIIVLAQGRLCNLACSTGHPSLVMSNSFCNQTLAQVALWNDVKNNTKPQAPYKMRLIPKHLDEKVARFHVEALGGELTTLTQKQADYIGVSVDGPYKNAHYQY